MTIRHECAEALKDRNVQAFLRVIREGETHQGDEAYRTIVGGSRFTSFDDHPRQYIRIERLGVTSSAAGAYQFLASTWDECAKALGLADFGPPNQDLAAVFLIRRRGALEDVIEGRIERAIALCGKEWASLPGSPYGQGGISTERALKVYAQWGGSLVGAPPIPPPSHPNSPPMPAGEADWPQEKPMAPIVAALLPSLIDAIPKLGKIFSSGSAVSERNVKAAEVVMQAVKTATGAPNEQAAVEIIQRDPAALQAATKAVEGIWWQITEAGGGGIEGARKANAGPLMSPALLVTLALLPLVYIALGAVLFRDGFSDDVKAMVLGAIFGGLLTGGITAFWFGTSASSQRKTELMGR